MLEKRSSKRKGITLIEILAVVAIIIVIIAILLPVVGQAKRRSQMASCTSNLKQIFAAYSLYTNDWNGEIAGSPLEIVPVTAYSSSKRIFQCPVERYIKPRSDGLFDSKLTDYKDESPGSEFRISYGYIRHFEPADEVNFWSRMAGRSQIGVFGCPWHGNEDPGLSGHPFRKDVIGMLDGPVIRVHGDGHVSTHMLSPDRRSINIWDLFYAPNSVKWVLFGED
jgi:type II secretory pathway pseudopilin PulG